MLNSTEHGILTAHKTKVLKHMSFLALKVSDVAFILLTNVKMPTIVGILTFFEHYKLNAQLSRA